MPITRRDFAAGVSAAALMPTLSSSSHAQTAAVTTRLPKTYAGARLRVLFGSGGAWDIMKRGLDEFSTATGIALEVTTAQYMDRYTKMMLDVTSGSNSFDTFPLAYQWKFDAAPYLADLSNINSEIKDSPPLDLEDYPAKPLEIYSKVDGRLISIPVIGDLTFIAWNKRLYEAAGLDPERGPATWEELVANGKKLTGGDKFGLGMAAGKNIQTACMWMLVFLSAGGRYFAENGQPALNSKEGVAALEYMVNQFKPISPSGNLTWDFSEVCDSFGSGQSAQALMWPAGFGIISDPKKYPASAGNFGWSVTPGGSLLGGHGVAVSAKSPNIEAAKLFVSWLGSKEIVRRTALNGGAPLRSSVLRDPELVAKYPFYPAVYAGLSGTVQQFMPVKEVEQIHRLMFEQMNAALSGMKPAKAACDDMQSRVLDFMKRRGILK